MVNVIVHADDFGISEGATDRIIETHLEGCLDRTSILPNGAAFDYAVQLLKKCPSLSYSVHFNIVEGKALSKKEKIPDLVDEKGFFKHSFLSLWLLYLLFKNKRQKLLKQIEEELYHQITRVKNALNCERVALDSHQYLHMLPFILDILKRSCKVWNIESIRIPYELFFLAKPFHINIVNLFSLNILKYLVLKRLSKKGMRAIKQESVSHPDYIIGIMFNGKMSLRVVQSAISKLIKKRSFSESVIEIIFHPGLVNKNEIFIWEVILKKKKFYISNSRLKEFNVLLSPEFKSYIREIKQAHYKKIGDSYGWIEYWNEDTVFPNMMAKIAPFFYNRTKPILNYSLQDVILDIGCGPGNLEYLLKEKVKEIYGIDTSQKYIEECRKRFRRDDNVFFYKLDEKNYTDLSFLNNKNITIIICLSVIQYYKSAEEVEMMIQSVKRIAQPGATLLIADIPVKHSVILDIFSLLTVSLKEKILFQTLKFLFQLRFSKYYNVCSSRGLLVFSESDLIQMTKKLGLNAEILKIPLTYNHGRLHLLINL